MNVKTKTKQTAFGAEPSLDKRPRASETPNEHLLPDFKTDKMDMGGQWGWVNFKPVHRQAHQEPMYQAGGISYIYFCISASLRIGVAYAKEDALLPYRFSINLI